MLNRLALKILGYKHPRKTREVLKAINDFKEKHKAL